MTLAFEYGAAAPSWALVLQAAEAWGQLPQTVAASPGSARWLARWRTYKQAEIEHRNRGA